jgi:hypothetical protein
MLLSVAWMSRRSCSAFREGYGLPMSVAAAVVALVVWTVVALAAGSWRTETRDA